MFSPFASCVSKVAVATLLPEECWQSHLWALPPKFLIKESAAWEQVCCLCISSAKSIELVRLSFCGGWTLPTLCLSGHRGVKCLNLFLWFWGVCYWLPPVRQTVATFKASFPPSLDFLSKIRKKINADISCTALVINANLSRHSLEGKLAAPYSSVYLTVVSLAWDMGRGKLLACF